MHSRPVLATLFALLSAGCTFIDDDHRAARIDGDGDGVQWFDDCNDDDDGVGLPSAWYPDTDGDGYGDADGEPQQACSPPQGYTDSSTDCDDGDAGVNPSALEYCNGYDDDCDGDVDEIDAQDVATWYADADGDGYGDPDSTTQACDPPSGYIDEVGDCDDSEPLAWDDADEVCDGVDNDCDGAVDDEDDDVLWSTWYLDVDGDGYGTDETTRDACDAPSGYVAEGGDCDDSWNAVNPGADELCDDADNDCDDEVDEDDATDAGTWYIDQDGDGHGDPSTGIQACDQPSDRTADGTDCDDSEPLAWEGADEVCDEVDNDCDGLIDDEDEVDDPAPWYPDSDGDGYGSPSGKVFYACTQPSGTAGSASDCDDSDATINPAAVEVCDGVDDDCDGIEDNDTECYDDDGDGYTEDAGDCDDGDAAVSPDAEEYCDGADDDCDGQLYPCSGSFSDGIVFTGEAAGDSLGAAVTFVGDADGDGLDDLLMGAPLESSTTSGAGAAYLLPGPVLGSADVGLPSVKLTGEAIGDGFGGSVASADLDDDGVADLIVGASDAGSSGYGGAYLFYGPISVDLGADLADAFLDAAVGSYGAGSAVATGGDVDGDGYPDLLVHDSSYRGNTGTSYLVLGGAAALADMDLDDAAAQLTGEANDDYAGSSLQIMGDNDGDGFDDILLGAWGNEDAGSDAGCAYVVQGPVTGSVDLGGADAQLTGAEDDGAGIAVSGVGDTNGDGYDDLLVGALYHDGSLESAGAAYLVLGPVSGGTLASLAEATLEGGAAHDWAGWGVGAAGDVDGDGNDDLLVGSLAQGMCSGSWCGGAHVVLSPASGVVGLADADSVLPSGVMWAANGDVLAGGGDTDGDGVLELLLGADADDSAGTNAGAVFMLELDWF